MKRKQNSKMRWFFRSFILSLVIIFSCIALFLGFSECYARMESKITGKTVKVIERKDHRIYFLEQEIFEWNDID